MEVTNSVHPIYCQQQQLQDDLNIVLKNQAIPQDNGLSSNYNQSKVTNHVQDYYQQNGKYVKTKPINDGCYVTNTILTPYADSPYTTPELLSHPIINTGYPNSEKSSLQVHVWGPPELYGSNFNQPQYFDKNLPVSSSKTQQTNSNPSNSNNSSIFDSAHAEPTPKSVEFGELKKPKIQTVYWAEKNTTCYQVRAKDYTVSRRLDNDYINGTKLLNIVGMSRGKRDGILKSEKKKDVVKVGSINLKGVWIPFDRAYEIARNEGLDTILFPIFVKDIEDYYQRTGHKLRTEDLSGEMQLENTRSDYEDVDFPPQEISTPHKSSTGSINETQLPNITTQLDHVFTPQYFEQHQT